nr:dysbindin domain-containing protein 1 isoform X2 [Cavia porcellus]
MIYQVPATGDTQKDWALNSEDSCPWLLLFSPVWTLGCGLYHAALMSLQFGIVKEVEVPQAALGVPAHGTGDSGHSPVAEEEAGIPIPAPGLLQVTERRQPLSSVSSLEVHFDLLDLTELTDMSDQELAEVFADSDDENLTSESPAGLLGKEAPSRCRTIPS